MQRNLRKLVLQKIDLTAKQIPHFFSVQSYGVVDFSVQFESGPKIIL